MKNVSSIPKRSLTNPNLRINEINDILVAVADLQRRVALLRNPQEELYEEVHFDEDFGAYSIFTLQTGPDYSINVARAAAKKAPGEVYLTNEEIEVVAGDDGIARRCPIIGFSRPYLIRYNGTAPSVGDKVHPVDGQAYVSLDPDGAFEAVSEADTEEEVVWIVRSAAGGGSDGNNGCKSPCACCMDKMVQNFQIHLENFGGELECCTKLNDDFTLTQHPDGGCVWVYCEKGFCTYDYSGDVVLDLFITFQIVGDCQCTDLQLEVALVEPGTGKTYLYYKWTKTVEAIEDCCLISEVLELECKEDPILECGNNEDESDPIAVVCAICPTEECEPCGEETRRYMLVTIEDVTGTNDCVCDFINGEHPLKHAETENCLWSETTVEVDLCELQLELTVESTSGGFEWTLKLEAQHDVDTQVMEWTATTETCILDDVEFIPVPSSAFLCDHNSSTVHITAAETSCAAQPSTCCINIDRKALRLTFLAGCNENLNGVQRILEPDGDINTHFKWQTEGDLPNVCNNFVTSEARVICARGQTKLTFLDPVTTSGCSWENIEYTFKVLQCDPYMATAEARIINVGGGGGPLDPCSCCEELLPMDVTLVLELAPESS